jgi:hypothetical protein
MLAYESALCVALRAACGRGLQIGRNAHARFVKAGIVTIIVINYARDRLDFPPPMRDDYAMTTNTRTDALTDRMTADDDFFALMLELLTTRSHDDLMILLSLDINELDELATRFELCPTHLCDYRICADDMRDDCAPLA